ncbi:MAG TPA: hypothetical protein VE732_05390 [Nitrososphaera sp.]|nr:hypothetical protein [Nitrososphaera sp.]
MQNAIPNILTRIKRKSSPYVVTFLAMFLSFAAVFGTPDGKLEVKEEEDLNSEEPEVYVMPSKKIPADLIVPKINLMDKAKIAWNMKVEHKISWKEVLMEFRKELKDHPSEEEIERRKQMAAESLKEKSQ